MKAGPSGHDGKVVRLLHMCGLQKFVNPYYIKYKLAIMCKCEVIEMLLTMFLARMQVDWRDPK